MNTIPQRDGSSSKGYHSSPIPNVFWDGGGGRVTLHPSPILPFRWGRREGTLLPSPSLPWYLPEKMDTINVQIKLQTQLDLGSPGMNVVFDGYTILRDIRKWFSVPQLAW